MQSIICLLCGIPGSGKSTWLQQFDGMNSVSVVSRDQIRFSMLSDTDEYFSKENEVFDKFIDTINDRIVNGDESIIYVDATHLNPKARHKVLSRLDTENCYAVHAIFFDISLDTCLERNEQRSGRAYVPPTVIKNMYNSYRFPICDEGFDTIWIIKETDEILELWEEKKYE